MLKFDETVQNDTCWVQACRCEWFAEEFKVTKQILQLFFEKCNFHKNCTFVLKFDETVQNDTRWVQAHRSEWFAELQSKCYIFFCENNNFHVNCAFVIIFNEMVQNGKR